MKKIIGVLLAVGLLFASAISTVSADSVDSPVNANPLRDDGGNNISNVADITVKGTYVDVRAYACINAAVAAISTTKTTLLVPNAQTLTANLTIPSTLLLKTLNGGSIGKAATYTLSINAPLEAGLYQVFSGFSAGDVTFGMGAVQEVYPEWWYTTDYGAAINHAIASIRALRGGKIVFTRNADITTPINATGLIGVIFDGSIGDDGGNGPVLTGKLNTVIFDCTSSGYLTFRNFTIAGDSSVVPKAGFLLSRDTSGGGAGGHRFYNMKSTYHSHFSVAVVYSYGSEEDDYYSCYFCNEAPGGKIMVISCFHIFSLNSPYKTIATGPQSSTAINIYGGSFMNLGGQESDILYLDGAHDIHIYGGFYYCGNYNIKQDGRSMVYVDTTNDPSSMVSIDGIRMENTEDRPTYGIYFGDRKADPVNWSLTNSRVSVKRNVVYVHDNVTLHNLTIKGAFPQYANVISAKYLDYPDINFGGDLEIRAGGLLKGGIVATSSLTLAGSATQATLIDLSTGSINSAYGFMHDRGNPAAPDFTQATLTSDGAVHDLNVSSIVPAGAKSVVLRVEVRDGAAGESISFCAAGLGSDLAAVFNKGTVYTQAADVYNCADVVVACDDARTIRYLATKAVWDVINITVRGWFKWEFGD